MRDRAVLFVLGVVIAAAVIAVSLTVYGFFDTVRAWHRQGRELTLIKERGW